MSQVETQKLPLWKKALFLAIPIVMFLGIMEVVLRFTVPFQNVRALCFHPIMERDYCPGVTGVIKYGTVLKVNSDGMLDRDYPVKRIPDSVRIALLGDSFTAAEEVTHEKRFHEIWETRLSKTINKKVEILNFGVRVFGTWEQLQMFHLKAAKYKPDWVVVNMFWGNDIADNINQFNAGAPNPLENDYPVDTLWSRILVTRKNFNKWLWNHSALYQWIRVKYNRLEILVKGWLRPEYEEQQERIKKAKEELLRSPNSTHSPEPKQPIDQSPPPTTPGKPPQIKEPPISDPASAKIKLEGDQPTVFDDIFFWDSKGWDLTRKLILKLKQDVENNGGHLALIYFPMYDQVHNYPELPRKQFNEFLEKNNIPYYDTFIKFKELSPEKLLEMTLMREYKDHHFSEEGNQIYADMTEPFLAKILTR